VTSKRGARRQREDSLDRRALADAVTARMNEIRIEQAELARQAGVSVSYLRHMQNGTGSSQFSYGMLSRVSVALRWPADHLVKIFHQLPEQDSVTPSGAEIMTQAVIAELRPYLEKIDAIDARLSAVMDLIHHVNNRIDVALDVEPRGSESQ